MSSPAKVLFIGIDAGDKDLILQWSRDGRLPTFRKLLQTSAWSLTQSPPGLYVGAIWPSFYTGVSPARHARYCYRQLKPGSYDIKWVSPRDVKHEPFWDALDRSGKRVAVIDVPKTYPSPLKNGLHIVDWGAHDPDVDSMIGQRGIRLSGGQRQRIGIARAVYRKPDILVLDEATNALDSVTESVVMDAILNLSHKLTIIMIAHRLNTVRNCDVIHYIDKGRIVSLGSYVDLQVSCERFRKMAGS